MSTATKSDEKMFVAGTTMSIDLATSYNPDAFVEQLQRGDSSASSLSYFTAVGSPSSSAENAEIEGETQTSSLKAAENTVIDSSKLTEAAADIKSALPHSFSTVDPASFLLRAGPDYNRNKLKAPAGDSLYDLVGVDFVHCERRIDDFASKVQLPEAWTAVATNHPLVPPLFVVNAQIPKSFATSFFTTVEDGEGWSLVLYFRISQATATALCDLANASGAVKLFAKYCSEGPSAFEQHGTGSSNPWVGRFKLLLRCERIDEFGLPSFITSYNAKPVLIRNTGRLIRGENYAEFDLNVHRFASLPKKGMEVMWGRFQQMQLTIAGCIEARTEDEMPEALFGCARLNFPSAETATARTRSTLQQHQQHQQQQQQQSKGAEAAGVAKA